MTIDPADATPFDTDMNGDDELVLSGAYRVSGGRRVARADTTIAIEPGTVFFVDNDAYVAFYGDATIDAKGTAE